MAKKYLLKKFFIKNILLTLKFKKINFFNSLVFLNFLTFNNFLIFLNLN